MKYLSEHPSMDPSDNPIQYPNGNQSQYPSENPSGRFSDFPVEKPKFLKSYQSDFSKALLYRIEIESNCICIQ